MLFESVGGSLIVGKIRGGKLSNLKDAEIKFWYFIVISFLIEFATEFLTRKGITFFSNYPLLISIVVYSFLFLGICFNLNQKAFWIILIGTFLNFLVIIINGGHMPVSANALTTVGMKEDIALYISDGNKYTHVLLSASTKLGFLADVIPIPKPYPFPNVISIGDIFLMGGIFIWLQNIIVKKKAA